MNRIRGALVGRESVGYYYIGDVQRIELRRISQAKCVMLEDNASLETFFHFYFLRFIYIEQ